MTVRRPIFRPWCRVCRFRYAETARGLCSTCELAQGRPKQ